MAWTGYQKIITGRFGEKLISGKYSDLTISCRDQEWRVHRAIVCTGSNFFTVACDGGFEENLTRRIVMDEDDPAILFRVLRFLYTGDYDDGKKGGDIASYSTALEATTQKPMDTDGQASIHGTSTEETLVEAIHEQTLVNVQVYGAADKLLIPELKSLAKKKFEGRSVRTEAQNFSAVLQQVLDATPPSDRGLRDIAVANSVRHLHELFDRNSDWASVLKQEPDLLVDILKSSTARFTSSLKAQSSLDKYNGLFGNTNLLKALERDSCRHCHAMFRPTLDFSCSDSSSGILRCRSCTTRHQY